MLHCSIAQEHYTVAAMTIIIFHNINDEVLRTENVLSDTMAGLVIMSDELNDNVKQEQQQTNEITILG